jgi:hypothetical protein
MFHLDKNYHAYELFSIQGIKRNLLSKREIRLDLWNSIIRNTSNLQKEKLISSQSYLEHRLKT